MPVAVNTGVVDTEARLSSERVVDMDPKIGLKETDNAQFMTILKNLPSTDATQVEVRWLEDQLFPNRTTFSASAASAATSFNVATSTGVYFRAGDIVVHVDLHAAGHVLQGRERGLAHDALEQHAPGDHEGPRLLALELLLGLRAVRGVQVASQVRAAEIVRERLPGLAQLRELGAALGHDLVLVLRGDCLLFCHWIAP